MNIQFNTDFINDTFMQKTPRGELFTVNVPKLCGVKCAIIGPDGTAIGTITRNSPSNVDVEYFSMLNSGHVWWDVDANGTVHHDEDHAEFDTVEFDMVITPKVPIREFDVEFEIDFKSSGDTAEAAYDRAMDIL